MEFSREKDCTKCKKPYLTYQEKAGICNWCYMENKRGKKRLDKEKKK